MNSSTEKQILVVGATGFLGMEICRQLRSQSKQVAGLVRTTSAPEHVKALKDWGVKLVVGDLKDKPSIKNALKGITTVISTATSTRSRADGDSVQTVDGDGQSNLVDEA